MAADVTSKPHPSGSHDAAHLATGQGARHWLWLSALVIVLDQVTKAVALANLTTFERVSVIPGFLDWTLAFNEGAAFSFLADAGGWQRWFFSVLAAVISVVLIVALRRIDRRDIAQALPFALIIGGALGNLIDRVRFGHVVDFILVYRGDWSWPAFNVADSAISVAAVLLIGSVVFSGWRRKVG